MKTLTGMAVGFASALTTIGLIGFFGWASIKLEIRSVDILWGALMGAVVLIAGAAIVIKMLEP